MLELVVPPPVVPPPPVVAPPPLDFCSFFCRTLWDIGFGPRPKDLLRMKMFDYGICWYDKQHKQVHSLTQQQFPMESHDSQMANHHRWAIFYSYVELQEGTHILLWFALESGTLPTPGSAFENSREFLAVAFSKVARHQLSHRILMGSKQKYVLGILL